MAIQRQDINLEVNGKALNMYVASAGKDAPVILVLPSWWGLKPFFKQVCDQLAERGYTALAPDYYGGRVGATVEEAQTLQQEAEGNLEAMKALIKAAKDKAASLRPGKPIAILGFSMGTDWAIITSASDPNVAAIVLFYGGFSVDFSKMKARVLEHYAEHDEWVPFDKMKEMEQDMKAAGVDVTIHFYPGVAHWFMESDRPEYNAEAADLAWKRTYEFLKGSMK